MSVSERIDPHRYPIDGLVARFETSSEFADAIGANRRHVADALDHGVRWQTADRWACRLGVHPSEIWSDWFDNVDLAVPVPDSLFARRKRSARWARERAA